MTLTNKLAQRISSELHYDEEKTAVISYGIFAFLQIFASIALVAFFGFLLGFFFQTLIVSFTSSILRMYSGGVHATKPSICLIVGTVATIANTIIAHYLTALVPIKLIICFIVLIIAFSYYIIVKYAPVDSTAKPIRTLSKQKKMKKLSLLVLSIYLALIFVLLTMYLIKANILYLEFATCICVAIGWQVFNLTIIGHRVLRKVDKFINQILFKTKENN